jgi:glycosyltransferase involved in cell wall biosynthesis
MSLIKTARKKRTAASRAIVIVTNMPAPYRIPIFRKLAQQWGYENFKVIYCTEKEGNRDWILNQSGFDFLFLKENMLAWKNRYIHFNFDVLNVLRHLNPEVVITTGFNPSFLVAFGYAYFFDKIHIPMTDGTLESEQSLSLVHRAVRRVVYRFSEAFIGASLGSIRLYKSYNISSDRIFRSHLCINNSSFQSLASNQRSFDLMFSGRFAPEKNPLFALDVAAGVAIALKRKVSLLMLGSGPLLEQAKEHAMTLSSDVEVTIAGFVQQDELPKFYSLAKVFLFPSSWDPWGVVANEACAAGQAVIVSPHAGAANVTA